MDAVAVVAAHCQASIRDNASLILALFMTGLVGSAGHCAGMCGPFVLAQIGGSADIKRLTGLTLLPYHLGRATTYISGGMLLAAPIGLLSRLDGLRWVPAAMLVVAAVIFVAQALRRWNLFAGWSPGFPDLSRALFARPVGLNGYALGVVLGFLPCGLLYAALGAAAATGDALAAGAGMFGFVLGTLPTLLAIGFAGRAAIVRWDYLARRAMPWVACTNAAVLTVMAWRVAGLAFVT